MFVFYAIAVVYMNDMELCNHTDTDAQLIQKAKSGDRSALEMLISRYLSFVYTRAFLYVKQVADAEDITQEVFVKVWEHLKKIDSSKNFKAWLGEITKNRCLDFLKKKRDISFSSFGEDGVSIVETLVDAPSVNIDQLEASLQSAGIAQKIALLSPHYQEVIRLYYREGFNLREIAERLREPFNTVKSRHRRAIQILRNLFFQQ